MSVIIIILLQECLIPPEIGTSLCCTIYVHTEIDSIYPSKLQTQILSTFAHVLDLKHVSRSSDLWGYSNM